MAPSRGVVHLFLARLLTRTLTAEQVQHHDQHRLPVRRGQGLLVLWHRRLRRLSAGDRTRSSRARTASGSGFGFHGLLSVLLLSVVLLPGAFSRHLFLSKRTRPGLRPNLASVLSRDDCRDTDVALTARRRGRAPPAGCIIQNRCIASVLCVSLSNHETSLVWSVVTLSLGYR